MATDVIYNKIHLHNVTTREWSQQVSYDETDTDQISTKYSMQFEGTFTYPFEPEADIAADLPGVPTWIGFEGTFRKTADNTVDLYKEVRYALNQPRKDLEVRMGGTTVLKAVPATDVNASAVDMDVASGPHPRDVQIIHLSSNTVFRIIFAIDCEIVECGTESGTPPPLTILNRWSVQEAMDTNFATTRTIQGKLRFSRNMKAAKVPYKGIIVCALEHGFRRDTLDFVASQNGLEADYTIVDKQVDTAAPWPATKIQAAFTEESSDGVNWFSDVTLTLDGPPGVDKRLLLARAFQVVEWRLELQKKRINAAEGEFGYRLEHAAMVEHHGERNAVTAHVRIFNLGGPYVEGGFHMRALADRIAGRPIELPLLNGVRYRRDRSYIPPMFGVDAAGNARDAAIMLGFMCGLHESPCQGALSLPRTIAGDTDSTKKVNRYNPKVSAYRAARLPEESMAKDNYLKEARESVYSTARMDSKYFLIGCRTQMPIAALQTNADPSSTTCVVTTLGRTQARREIRVESERAGKWPIIPAPVDTYEDGDIQGTLLKHWIKPQPPTLAADGQQKVFRVLAYYLYALNRPPTPTEKINTGILPFTTFTQSQNQFDPNKSYSTIVGP